MFSTVLNRAKRAQMILANPGSGVRVTGGAFDTERLAASPAQAPRAAMRLYEMGLGVRSPLKEIGGELYKGAVQRDHACRLSLVGAVGSMWGGGVST
ncbi:hypothetical protein QRX50_28670 [Amycolatopsis carbonis]|uniref:Uncharacterized protein n=1 Tax=Amycolatopsis carbonis TaxID=715471 RepID=A0A9Y2IA36_9PSEU|nr:hypothetical protein [Amycolatopsis sp. 2-15]WIX75481.1 hypothetical protein QRX50_28670 [Amycolatopsis sp. 2-15]